MKRGILTGMAALGFIGLAGSMTAMPASAQWGSHHQAIRQDRHDIHADNRSIRHDRMAVRRDLAYGHYHAAEAARRDLHQDMHARRTDHRDLRHDAHHGMHHW